MSSETGAHDSSYVSIVDVHSQTLSLIESEDEVILWHETDESDIAFLDELYSLVEGQLTKGRWINYGPDSRYRRIVFFNRGRKVDLRSWHPLVETDANLVASSRGLTALDGRSRDEFLWGDDPDYVAARNAFDAVEARLRERYLRKE